MTKSEFEKLKSELVSKKQLSLFVQGMSMHPVISEQDTITVGAIQNSSDLKLFDLIVLWDGNLLKCHYLWTQNKIVKNYDGDLLLRTRALNPLNSFDPPVPMDHVLGKLQSHKLSFGIKVKILLHYLLNK